MGLRRRAVPGLAELSDAELMRELHRRLSAERDKRRHAQGVVDLRQAAMAAGVKKSVVLPDYAPDRCPGRGRIHAVTQQTSCRDCF